MSKREALICHKQVLMSSARTRKSSEATCRQNLIRSYSSEAVLKTRDSDKCSGSHFVRRNILCIIWLEIIILWQIQKWRINLILSDNDISTICTNHYLIWANLSSHKGIFQSLPDLVKIPCEGIVRPQAGFFSLQRYQFIHSTLIYK
jgi:hypothetical protein